MRTEPGSGRAATVLLVDQSAEVGFGLRASLSRLPGLRLVEAADHDQAMDVLVTQMVDVIVACVQTPETEAFPLLARVQQQEHLALLPFVVVADDDRVATKVQALQGGATDYVARPFSMTEITARVEAAARRRSGRDATAGLDGCLAGDLAAIAVSDLVHLLQIGRRTGMLTLLTRRATGRALFVDGQVYHATYGSMEGEEAFYRLVWQTRGHFEFRPCEVDLPTVRNTVALRTTTLLMEAARRQDSWRRDHPDAEMPDAEGDPAPRVAPPDTLLPAAPGTELAAAELGELLARDAGGTLRLLGRGRLPMFTTAAAAPGRCLVLLVADKAMATAAMCDGARAPGPDFVAQALGPDANVLTLGWQAPSGARLDVLLVDQESIGRVVDELRAQPAALLVAPRGGDWCRLSVTVQDELATALGDLHPGLLVGLGGATLEEGLTLLRQRAGIEFPTRCLPTPLQLWAGLRDALHETLQHWAAMPTETELPVADRVEV